jgi:L-serine dehydratase
MVAARDFVGWLGNQVDLAAVVSVRVELYGSLAMTGIGHSTDRAIVLGLMGEMPETVSPGTIAGAMPGLATTGLLLLNGTRTIALDVSKDIVFRQGETLPHHSNGMIFIAETVDGRHLTKTCYSIGGGFVVDEAEFDGSQVVSPAPPSLPHIFQNGDGLLQLCDQTGLAIADIVLANAGAGELAEADTFLQIEDIWNAMSASIDRGCRTDGVLPGRLKVARRAPGLFRELEARENQTGSNAAPDALAALDQINLWAIAVNEENAAGGRIVTAPTNGAAGIIPAVIRYYERYHSGDMDGIRAFFLTSTAIGSLYKMNASISGAEVGCQGEVGVACSMAAAGLTAALGGTARQVENAAEIGMEHNLGLTCDPIGGLVQIPCIERNAMGAVKAIDASRLAMMGDGKHMVSLDKVIETMRQTGLDMATKYKETSEGGLAVNVVEC